jgi:diguanylate cyclase (GGDEF)-like protein/PAS domain S-box-containing protein
MGVILLAGAIFGTVSAGHQAALATLDHGLTSDAAGHATALEEYFDRAKSIDLLLAHDSALLAFAPGRNRLSKSEITAASAQAGRAMAYLQELYPGRISEACLIDDTGTEWARVVQGVVAPESEMSTEEAKNPFFAPTLALPKGRVFQAAPYVSADTHNWVISNSTPMYSASGRPWGLAHFEVTLDTFRPHNGNHASANYKVLIVDNRTGQVILDSMKKVVGTSAIGQPASAELRAAVSRPGDVASVTVDAQRMAVARVPTAKDNANSWSVVVIAPTATLGWSASIGPAPVATALAALLLLAFAGLNLRASRQTERKGEARYRALIDQSSDLVLVTDRTGTVRFLSPSAERLLGAQDSAHNNDDAQDKDIRTIHAPAETGPIDLLAAVDPQDREQLSAALQAAVPGRGSAVEIRLPSRQGVSSYEVTVQDLTADASVGGLVLTAHDVTERLALEKEMEHRALHDELTGLPNRELLAVRFQQALRSAERDGTKAGLLLIDLDRFKEINDTFGHHYGDELLKLVGPRLTDVLRDLDTVARLGGDEFAVLLPDVVCIAEATAVAAKLRVALETPFHVEGVDLDVEASVGVVISGDHGRDATTLLQRADIAMYVAKTRGLGLFAYDPDIDGHSPAKLALLGELRRALDRDELLLHYQPKVSISNGDIVGAEALVRWQHPERGLVFPDAFIPLAELTGLISTLTHYVLDAAMTQARTWVDAGRPLPIAVNLSTRNLHDERLVGDVAALLAHHRVPGALVVLEVTESAIMIDPVRANQTLQELSALGVRLAIDDFGAGYTSLSQLTSLPINEIKIDRSFVMKITDFSSSALIVSSVVELGHNLGMTLVAEGVENEEALTALAGLGCDVAQGYHISRPITAAAFDIWSAGRPIRPVLLPTPEPR